MISRWQMLLALQPQQTRSSVPLQNGKGNYKYLTELVMVLNHKIWQWFEKNAALAAMYNDFWEIADQYALNNLKGEELDYFYTVTD